jgi:hypothetical protein
MLDPNSRLVYLEAIRPPAGYKLDQAIATTFSLDLLSLLMAPLSLVFSEHGDQTDLLRDPIAFLEALRRSRDKLVVFCQVGRIAIPKIDTRLYSYLEPMVIEVQPPGLGVFHPKIWLLRYVPSEEAEPIFYRLLCLSRNLTFDRSWDTLLTLEGCLNNRRQRGFGINRPLADFIRALPTFASPNERVSPTIQTQINLLADEVSRVWFDPPDGFDEIVAFRPSGIEGYKRLPFSSDCDRLLVVSPFLTNGWVKQSLLGGQANLLISRADSLDALKPDTIAQLEADNIDLYFMNEAAERPDDEEPGATESSPVTTTDLSGLHAKLYIAESGRDATILTGSANASKPGFNGTNVEFMVELKGKRSRVGINQFLGQEGQSTSFLSLLQHYRRSERTLPPGIALQQKLERMLDDARRALCLAGLSAIVSPGDGETYSLTLTPEHRPLLSDQPLWGRCAPISLHFNQAQDIKPILTGQSLTFSNLSLVGLTGFFAFELTAELEEQVASIGFVLNLPVKGMPPERDQRILYNLIADKNRFIRYLLFLLAEDSEFGLQELLGGPRTPGNGAGAALAGLPLLEELVRASSRQPEKIDRIATLVESLAQVGPGQDVLPEGFSQIWGAFLALRPHGGK